MAKSNLFVVIIIILLIILGGVFSARYYFLKKTQETEEKWLELADSQYNGLASVFNCKMENEYILTCDYSLRFAKEGSRYDSLIKQAKELKRPGFENKKIWMILEDEDNWDKVKNIICQRLLNDNRSRCQDLEETLQKRLWKMLKIKGCQCNGIGIYLRKKVLFYEFEK